MLQRREADLTYADLTNSYARSQVTSYSIPVKAGALAIFRAKTGVDQKSSWKFYATTFGADCWIAFAVSFVSLSLGFALIYKFRHETEVQNMKKKHSLKRTRTTSYIRYQSYVFIS